MVTRHGMAGTSIYRIWQDMRRRCEKPRKHEYPHYGGRGIRVCERWRRFENFYADMGPRPEGLTLDRIDNDGDYEPGNCRWATWAEQRANQRKPEPRPRSHCPHGHELAGDNVYVVTRNDGRRHRACRACKLVGDRERQRRYMVRRKARRAQLECAP